MAYASPDLSRTAGGVVTGPAGNRGVPFYFLLAAAICVTSGMVWGLVMSGSGDHALASAHAHLNLVGWVTMALFGIYYRLTPAAAAAPLARVHLVVAVLGIAIMAPGIALAILGKGELLAIVGSLLTFASMLIFLWTVARRGFGNLALS